MQAKERRTMGVDLIGIIGHKMNKEEIIQFPGKLDSWIDLRAYLKDNNEIARSKMDFKSQWKSKPSKESIEKLWIDNETDSVMQSNWIETYFGDINIYRNNLTIEIDSIQKYGNFQYPEVAKRAIEICRIIAKKLNEDRVVFCPDSAYPTSIVYDYAIDGLTIDEIIYKGIEKFGKLPLGVSKGRKNFFFVDYVNQEIGELKNWDEEEEFWRWDDEAREYQQIKDKASM